MVSPAKQGRIQIEITNACPHACSNCTRFTRLVSKPFWMDLPTFQKAVDSMAGYQGMLGIMGGEPTLHPDFARLVEYYREHWHPGPASTAGRKPIADFAAYHAAELQPRVHTAKRGLWSSLGPGYAKHFELIQESFPYQCINTHTNQARHQAILVGRRELGISDDDWRRLRDRCWVQRLWSSSITPKGCFPCEIMASLDMLYDGPGGWPIEPGWWQRTPAEFGDMLQWCELCGLALETPARLATDQRQDVSPDHARRLERIGSPAIATGLLEILDVDALAKTAGRGHQHASADWYMPAEDKTRRAAGQASLTPRKIEGVVVSVDCGDQLRRTLPANAPHFDHLAVVTAPHDKLTQAVARDCGVDLVVTDACYLDGDAFNKGRMLNAGLQWLEPTDWVILHDADVFLPPGLGRELRRLVLNPGCLYYTKRHHLPPEVERPDWALVTDYERLDPHGNHAAWGYFQLFNMRAQALAGGIKFPTCFCSAGTIDYWTMAQWPREKRISLADWAGETRFDVLHLWHGTIATRWNGYQPPNGGWRFAGQTSFGTEAELAAKWPIPCRVRRINAVTLETDEAEWDGTTATPRWPRQQSPGSVFEYSVKAETPHETA